MAKPHRISRDVFLAVPGLEVAETLFDSLPDVLFCIKDLTRKYVGANDAFARAAGLRSRADLLGWTARDLFPAALAAGYEQQDDGVLAGGPAVRDRLEMITRRDGGLGWFVSQKIPVTDAAGNVIALAGISRDLDTAAATGAAMGPLAAALDRLHTAYSEPLRIAELAAAAGMSTSQFQRRVLSMTGLTPRQLLTKIRVEAAAKALRDGSEPLSTVAAACGFYDQAVLTRQFRELTGVPPGEYRRAFRTVGG